MLGRLFTFVFAFGLTTLVRAFWFGAGLGISAAIRLSPWIYRSAVMLTGSTLARIDQEFGGRIADSHTATYIAAGGLWAFAGLAAPWLLALLLLGDSSLFSPVAAGIGFLFGLAIGRAVPQLPGWGWWLEEGRVKIGENR